MERLNLSTYLQDVDLVNSLVVDDAHAVQDRGVAVRGTITMCEMESSKFT
jgi:hypothetical protein